MVLAWLNARQRNLGRSSTPTAGRQRPRQDQQFPSARLSPTCPNAAGTQRELFDPFAEKRVRGNCGCFLLALVGIAFGWWQGKAGPNMYPSQLRSTTVLGTKRQLTNHRCRQ